MQLATVLLAGLLAPLFDPAVIESSALSKDVPLSADPNAAEWRDAPGVKFAHDYLGKPIEGPPTEVRSRWTKTHLYLLYICPYTELTLKADPTTSAETPRLWNWDVGEVFIGPDRGPITQYKELQVSPQGEWVDLDIDREHPKELGGMGWNSGFSVKARIDKEKKIWYGEMRIPFAAIDDQAAEKARTFRIGIYRIAGAGENRQYYAWRPTAQKSFHVPQAFGTLRLH